MADPSIVLQVFRLLTANQDLEEAVLQGVTGMLISLLILCSLTVLSAEKIHLLLADFRVHFLFGSVGGRFVSDFIGIFVFWEIIQVTNKLFQEVDDVWWDYFKLT